MSDDNIIHFSPWQDYNDAPQVEDPFSVEPDPVQIETFLDVVFGYCEGLIPIRGFVDMGQGKEGRPHNIWIDADVIAPAKLATFANWAWREGAAVYVIPGTVAAAGQAKSADVLQMQALVVDLDAGDIPAKLDHLLRHLGQPILIIESRGSLRIAAKIRAETMQGRVRQATENAKDSAVPRGCSWFVRHDS